MITILLIALNLIVYILMVFSGVDFFAPTPQQILAWGGCNNVTILHGEPWRLLTAMFVHFGVIHLLMNLYALYDLGSTLERIIGKARLLTAYLATGIFGGLVSQIWHLDSYAVEAGASGGVFGIVGVLVALLTTRLFPEEVRIPYLKRILGMVAVNLVYGMQTSVNMAAHMGGLLSGFILGYGLYFTMIHEKKIIKQAAFFFIPLITLISVSGTLKYMKSSDFFKFDEIVSEIDSLQTRVKTLHEEMPTITEEIGDFFKTAFIPEWERGEFLIAQSKNLHLSGDKAKYRDYLEKWVDLNAKKYRTWALEVQAIERNEDTQIYQNMTKALDDQIAQLTIDK
jgi:rhomboid protease GluP